MGGSPRHYEVHAAGGTEHLAAPHRRSGPNACPVSAGLGVVGIQPRGHLLKTLALAVIPTGLHLQLLSNTGDTCTVEYSQAPPRRADPLEQAWGQPAPPYKAVMLSVTPGELQLQGPHWANHRWGLPRRALSLLGTNS